MCITDKSLFPASNVESLFSVLSDYTDPFVLFTSGLNDQGDLWCPDCRLCQPVVIEIARSCGKTVVICNVGSKEYWKDKAHPFRHDARVGQLNSIPTLQKWSSKINQPTMEIPGEKMEGCRTVSDVETLVKPFFGLQ